jgi:hypothetical protein
MHSRHKKSSQIFPEGFFPRRMSAMRVLVVCVLTVGGYFSAEAKVTKITIEKQESPAYSGKSFGDVGTYETLTGHAYGEIDPKDPHNKIITDIDLAPRNSRGMVEYIATFTLQKPVDLSKANGVLIYAVSNRGGSLTTNAFSVEGDSGNDFFMKRGYMILHSGWQGDIREHPGAQTIRVPIARNPDGSSVTGAVLERFSDMPAGTHTQSLFMGRPAANLDTAQATLTMRAAESGPVIPIASSDWAFSDSTHSPFPGEPDATKISVRGGFDPAYLYEVVYTAKDPLVLGIGLAATRDIVSFFHHETTDSDNTANPIAGRVTHVIAHGMSQSGNFIRTFIHLGFNEDESGRMVWDGANPGVAARQLAINFRFACVGGIATMYDPGSEGTLWWGDYTDTARGQQTPSSLLDRSRASKTSPKIFETFGSSEFWDLRMSPDLVGTKADRDIPLPSNVRRYYFPGTTHGSGSGIFSENANPSGLQLPNNPNSEAYTMRALFLELTDWVTKDIPPPASVYPRLADGQLVPPDHSAMGFPSIPGEPLPDGHINPFFDYDFGPQLNYPELSGVITIEPPKIKNILPQLVPRVDADGNEIGGIPSVYLQAPLGTYLGWNISAHGFFKGQREALGGGFIPFAKTRDERLANGDPRPSLEERYHDHAGFVAAVKKATQRLLDEHFLLPEDAERLVRQADSSNVLK